jgi:lauroyl/myristoyl acyltransferase
MSVVENLDKFTTLARYAPDETDTEDKKKDHFLNGLQDEMQCILVVMPFLDLETLADVANMMEDKHKTTYHNHKRKMMMQHEGASNQKSHSMPPPRSTP